MTIVMPIVIYMTKYLIKVTTLITVRLKTLSNTSTLETSYNNTSHY